MRLLVRDKQKMDAIFNTPELAISDYLLGDVTDKEVVKKAVQGCDTVIHTAAAISIKKVEAKKLQVSTVNISATENVMSCALEAGVEKIIHTSSISALFRMDGGEITKTSPLASMDGEYGKSKVACELYVRELQKQGAPITIIYPGGVIGPEDPGLSETMWGITTVFTDGTMCTSSGFQVIDVRDIATVCHLLLEKGKFPERYLIPGTYMPWQETGDLIETIAGAPVRRLKGPGVMYRMLGKVVDIVSHIIPLDTPLTYESMVYATKWQPVELDEELQQMGFAYRSREESFKDTIQWMLNAGHVQGEHVPLLNPIEAEV